MHCTLPTLSAEMNRVMGHGVKHAELAAGRLLAHGMALGLEVGFGYLLRDSLLNADESDRASAFFKEHFEILDPLDGGLAGYYQGRFLIRTRKEGDDLNVMLRFCPDPERLYRHTPFGAGLDPCAVVVTEALSEAEADRIESDPSQVDLVIRFKNSEALLGLLSEPEADPTALMLENVVQVSGNLGHLFKLGAIAQGIDEQMKVH